MTDCDSHCRFRHDEQMPPGAMKIDCSAEDFTAVEPGQDFVVTVSYTRPIEGQSLISLGGKFAPTMSIPDFFQRRCLQRFAGLVTSSPSRAASSPFRRRLMHPPRPR